MERFLDWDIVHVGQLRYSNKYDHVGYWRTGGIMNDYEIFEKHATANENPVDDLDIVLGDISYRLGMLEDKCYADTSHDSFLKSLIVIMCTSVVIVFVAYTELVSIYHALMFLGIFGLVIGTVLIGIERTR